MVLKDTGEKQGDLFGQSLNLISKEKLPEEDVQLYKSWLIEHTKEDTFETLVQCLELRIQIMEEERKEKRKEDSRQVQRAVSNVSCNLAN